MDVIVQYI